LNGIFIKVAPYGWRNSGRTRLLKKQIDLYELVMPYQIGSLLPRFNPGREFKRILDVIKFNKN
jgi:hypothetical protein